MPELDITPEQAVADIQQNLIPEESTWPPNLSEEIKTELRLRRALQVRLSDLIDRMKNGELISQQEMHAQLNEVAHDTVGLEYGIPMPPLHDMNRKMVTASRVPLAHVEAARTEFEEELAAKVHIRNSWSKLGDQEICVVDTEEGPIAIPRYHSGIRLRKILDSLSLRAGMSIRAETELRAMDSLKKRINARQFDHYVLSGVFPERSPRSDIHYFFRKGLPTLACSFHGYEQGRVIAALCLHPLGYYQGSHVGLMCPTDEVISALLMMRSDEHFFWRSSGQWSASDSRSGI